MSAGASAAVRVRRLRVVRGGHPAVDDVSFEVPARQVTGLLGPSGSGKSSLIRAVVGVQIVAGGSVEVLGHPSGSAELRHRIGYVTQAPSVYDDLTVEENIRFFARVLGLGADAVSDVVHAVDLGRHTHHRVAALSGGERSRVSLAVALLGRPDLLVLDEPTVGLDPVLRRDLWALFHRLADDGAAVLVSSHVMDEASRCDRLLLMRDGRLVADDAPEDLLARTGCTDVESAFLALVKDGPAS
ncbi:MAG: type transport system ATP-binding protein [Nocardioidaceae bacterium]|nr:type transport system ATP-binding protein [Nocardioidaceae bacterium]